MKVFFHIAQSIQLMRLLSRSPAQPTATCPLKTSSWNGGRSATSLGGTSRPNPQSLKLTRINQHLALMIKKTANSFSCRGVSSHQLTILAIATTRQRHHHPSLSPRQPINLALSHTASIEGQVSTSIQTKSMTRTKTTIHHARAREDYLPFQRIRAPSSHMPKRKSSHPKSYAVPHGYSASPGALTIPNGEHHAFR